MGVVKQKCSFCGAELDLYAENTILYCPCCAHELHPQKIERLKEEPEVTKTEVDSTQAHTWTYETKERFSVPVFACVILFALLIDLANQNSADGPWATMFSVYIFCVAVIIGWLSNKVKTKERIKWVMSWKKTEKTCTTNFGELRITASDKLGFEDHRTDWGENRLRAEGKAVLDIERIRFDDLESDELKTKMQTGIFFREQYRNMQEGKVRNRIYRYGYPEQNPFCIQSYCCTSDSYYKITVQCSEQNAGGLSRHMIDMIGRIEENSGQ